jgi:hypothetical protein
MQYIEIEGFGVLSHNGWTLLSESIALLFAYRETTADCAAGTP